MVVTKLLGGLGNQLFQYAIGRAIAERHSTTLKLDTAELTAYGLRPYKLGYFNIRADLLGSGERRSSRVAASGESAYRRLTRRLLGPRLQLVRERSFGFDPSVLDASADCYLDGYWQSPRYFASIEAKIRAELTLREPLAGDNATVGKRIADTVSASLHVRRGDYAANPATRDYHGLCGMDYYERAQRRLLDTVGPVRFYVFSDDPGWVRKHLPLLGPAEVMEQNGLERDFEDLALMVLCRHHIVANSTFSWWGAWLSSHPDKTVIAPQKWFGNANLSTDDLIPQSWCRL